MAQYGPYDRSLRAADSDREAVADILREQHVAGRLDSDELQDRVDRCYAAKTYAELDAVIADLPHEQPQVSGGLRLWPRFAFVPLLLIAVIASATGTCSGSRSRSYCSSSSVRCCGARAAAGPVGARSAAFPVTARTYEQPDPATGSRSRR